MASVSFRNVNKSFDGTVSAVAQLSLEIEDGELLVLVGPSGCGKSTILRLLAGLEASDSGEIRIGDREVSHLPPQKRDVAMVFQNYALYPHMTVARNLDFPLRMIRMRRAQRKARIAEVAKALRLNELLDRRPGQLSGGQRQRVAMGRALVREPAVFLMDEPLSNLDAKLRLQMRGEITELQRRLRTTTLYVTHDQVEAMTMGDRLAVLDRGRLQQIGSPQALYNRPANLFVATFIGSPSMNIVTTALRPDAAAGLAILLGGEEIPVSHFGSAVLSNLREHVGRRIHLGFRPESVRVVRNGAGASIRAHVKQVELLGHEQVVYFELGEAQGRVGASSVGSGSTADGMEFPLQPLSARIPPSTPVAIGQEVSLELAPDGVHFFDESGLRID